LITLILIMMLSPPVSLRARQEQEKKEQERVENMRRRLFDSAMNGLVRDVKLLVEMEAVPYTGRERVSLMMMMVMMMMMMMMMMKMMLL
jgi:hypothetical protein